MKINHKFKSYNSSYKNNLFISNKITNSDETKGTNY